MTNGADKDAESKAERDLIEWIKRTPLAFVLAVVSLVSGPAAFLAQFGIRWFLFAVAAACWIWWWHWVFSAKPLYSRKQVSARALLPSFLTIALLVLLFVDVSSLNIFRRDYDRRNLGIAKYGSVTKHFLDTAPRTTPDERQTYQNNEWIRWLPGGAKSTYQNSELLYIETEPFNAKFHTFTVDVHSLDKKLRPQTIGVAFLVHDPMGDLWTRPVLRQVPCDFSSDANTRLFRVEVQNPEPGESLQLFLCVTPAAGTTVDLENLNLELLVR